MLEGTGGWSNSEPILQGQIGMTQNPYGVMSSPRQCQTLPLKASFKPLQLTWGMSCHQHSSMMKEKKQPFKWKVSAPGAVRVHQLHAICSLNSLHDTVGESMRGTWLGLFSHPWVETCRNIQCKPWADGREWKRSVGVTIYSITVWFQKKNLCSILK